MICRDTPTHPWVDVWVVGWVSGSNGGSGQMTNNWINLELIKIIQFCLKIYDLERHPHPWVGVWVVGWVSGSMGGVRSNDYQLNKSWPNWNNSILFEDLWFIETPPPMGGCVGGSVGQWVGSGQMTNNLINLDLIEIIQFCLKIYDL